MDRLKVKTLTSFQNKGNLETLVRTTALLGVRICGAVFGFALVVILTRSMSTADLGFTLRLLSLTVFIGAFSTLNIDIGAMRHMLQPLIRGEVGIASGFMHFTRRIFYLTFPAAIVLFFLLVLTPDYFTGRVTEERLIATCLAALTIPVLGYTKLCGAWGYANQKIVTINFFGQFFRNFLVSSVLVAVFFQGQGSLTIIQFFTIHLIAAILTLAAQEVSLMSVLTPLRKVPPVFENKNKLLMTGIYLLAASLPYDYLQNISVAVAGFTMSEYEVGLLAIVLRFLPLLLIGIFALNAAIDPKVATAFADHDKAAVQAQIRFSNLVKVVPTVVITGIIWVYAPQIMAIFGPEFTKAEDALRLVAILPCVSVFFGPSVLILNAAGEQRAIFTRSVASSLLILTFVATLGGLYGVTGATLGAVIGVIIWEFLLFRRVLLCVGINISLPASLWVYGRLQSGDKSL